MRYIITISLIISLVTTFAISDELSLEELRTELSEALSVGDFEKVNELANIVEQKYPRDPELVEMLLTVYMFKGNRDKFMDKLDEMITEYPEDARWLLFKAQGVLDDKDPTTYETAEEYLITAKEVAPDDPTVFYFHGYIKMMKDEYKSAKTLFEKALDLNEVNDKLEDLNLAEIYYNLGCIYATQDDPETAVEYLTRAFEIESQFVQYSQGDPDLETLLDYQPYKDAVEKYGEEVGVNEYPPTVPVGETAPDFELKGLDGDTHKLSDYKGKVVLLNFWATWCPPCVDEIPGIAELYTAYEDDGLVVIGVSYDNPSAMDDDTLRTNSEELGVNYLVLRGDEEVAERFISSAGGVIPQTYIIDREGVVVDFVVGSRDKAVFEEMIEPYL